MCFFPLFIPHVSCKTRPEVDFLVGKERDQQRPAFRSILLMITSPSAKIDCWTICPERFFSLWIRHGLRIIADEHAAF